MMHLLAQSYPKQGSIKHLRHAFQSQHPRKMTQTHAAPSKSCLVSPEWLSERLKDPDVKILDGSWYIPTTGRNAIEEFKKARIPGAQFFDVDGVANLTIPLPHMVPSAAQFAAVADALGIAKNDSVVIYDCMNVFSAPRVWWTFKIFGHEKVYILNGGLPAWQKLNLPVEITEVGDDQISITRRAAQNPPETTSYMATFDKSKVRSIDDMVANISSHQELVLDARSAGRFAATEPEPRKSLRGGHIPGSKSLPMGTMLKDGQLKSVDELKAVFAERFLDPSVPLVASCGSGMTACILAAGIYEVTGKVIPIYDGSWTEYGAREDVPVETGA